MIAGTQQVTALAWLDADGNGDLCGSPDSPNVTFDAAPYLLSDRFNARILDGLCELHREGDDYVGLDYPSDAIAHAAADYDLNVKSMFDSQGELQGFGCCIDWDELVTFVKEHRPELIKDSKVFRYFV